MDTRNAVNLGDRETAERNSKQAKQLGMATVIIGLVLIVVVVAVSVVLSLHVFSQFTDAIKEGDTKKTPHEHEDYDYRYGDSDGDGDDI